MMWTASSSAPPGYSFWRLIDGRSSSLDAIEFRVTGLCLLATSMGTNTFQSVSSSAATSSNLGVFSVLEFLQVTDDFCWRHRQQKGHHCGFSIDETKDVEVGHGGGNRGYCQMDEWLIEWLCDWVRTERRMREKKGFGDNPLSPIGSWYHLMSWWGSVNWNRGTYLTLSAYPLTLAPSSDYMRLAHYFSVLPQRFGITAICAVLFFLPTISTSVSQATKQPTSSCTRSWIVSAMTSSLALFLCFLAFSSQCLRLE